MPFLLHNQQRQSIEDMNSYSAMNTLIEYNLELREASTDKGAKTHDRTVFVPRDLDLWIRI